MQFTPIDEKEYAMRDVWPSGWYAATIGDAPTSVIEKISKSGNNMFQVNLIVYGENGGFKLLTAYIMADGKAAFQLREAAEAFGVLEQYREGKLTAEDLKGKSGYVKLGIEEDLTGQYKPKNKIVSYRAELPKNAVTPKVDANAPLLGDDEIPF